MKQSPIPDGSGVKKTSLQQKLVQWQQMIENREDVPPIVLAVSAQAFAAGAAAACAQSREIGMVAARAEIESMCQELFK